MNCFVLKGRKLQYVASLLASTYIASSYISLSWISAVTILLTSNDTPLNEKIELSNLQLFYLSIMIGSIVGNIFLGPLINYFGRKGTLLVMCIPTTISWVMILFGRSFGIVLAARFLLGFALYVPINVSVMYIAEIAETSIRGKLSVFCLLAAEIGAIITMTVGPASYHGIALIAIIIPVFSLCSFWFMPETPYFYLNKGNQIEAKNVLLKLRNTDDVDEEFKQMTFAVEENLKRKGTLCDIFSHQAYRKAFLIIIGLKTLQEFSGGNLIQANMTAIFEIADTGLDSNKQSLLCILIPFPFMLLASYFIDRFGRKPLLYTSAIGSFVALLLEAIYFFIQDANKVTESLAFLPVTGIFVSFIFKAIGISSIPILLMNELLPTNIIGVASSVILVYGSVLSTVTVILFIPLIEVFRLSGCFLIFAICCLLGLAFVKFFVPETKGKSLAEIHQEF